MIVNLILGVTIALLPLYLRILEIDFNRECKDYLLVAIFALCITLLPLKKRKLSKYTYFVFTYLIIMGALNQWNVASVSVVITSFTFYIGAIFCIRFYESFDEHSIQFIFDGMIIGSLIQGILAMGGYFGYTWYFDILGMFIPIKHGSTDPGFGSAVGSLGNVNMLSSYLCICIPAFLTRKKWLWMLPIPVYALFLSQGRMGIGALIAGTIYFVLVKKGISKFFIYMSAIAAMIYLPVSGLDIGDSGRFPAWRLMVSSMGKKHLLIGKGLGWFATANFPLYPNGEWILSMEHNAYLTILNAFGLLGFLVLLPIFYKFLKTKDSNPFLASILFIIFCNSYGHFTLQQSTVMVIIVPMICIYGGIERCSDYLKGNQKWKQNSQS